MAKACTGLARTADKKMQNTYAYCMQSAYENEMNICKLVCYVALYPRRGKDVETTRKTHYASAILSEKGHHYDDILNVTSTVANASESFNCHYVDKMSAFAVHSHSGLVKPNHKRHIDL